MTLCINPKCSKPENSDQMLFCLSCGSELLLAGRYRATRLISNKGGFGDTYEVTEREVPKVLKVLKTSDAKAIELFEREFRVLSSLTAAGVSGIPNVEDLFLYTPRDSSQALHCLVMERIYGMDLEEYIQAMKRPIDEKTAIGWLSQLTHFLQEIHERGIFHRDIKPSNIILQPDGQLVLIDFGAVKEAATKKPGQATCIFTPGYAAPEQQKPGQASAQSDFFSLGRTFVYLLTNQDPSDLYDTYSDQIVWRSKTTNVSADFLNLIDQLMQKDPLRRPENAQSIFQELADLQPISTYLGSGFSPPSSSLNANTSPQPAPAATIAPPALPPQRNGLLSLLAKIWLPLLAILLIVAAWKLWPKTSPSGEIFTKTGESFNDIKEVPSGVFKFGGSTTWATTRQLQSSIDAAMKGVFPKFDIVYTDATSPSVRSARDGRCDQKPGSNSGICWLIEGDLDFAQSSVALEKSKYADQVQSQSLRQVAVAYDALSVVINPQLKIPGLSVDQLRAIYTGKVKNWNQLGGPNLPITAFSRPESAGGTVSSFKDLVMQKEDEFVAKAVRDPSAGLQQVQKNLGGIFFGSAKEVIVDFCQVQPIAIGQTGNKLVKPYQDPLQSPEKCNQGQRNKINTTVIKNQEYPLNRKIYVIIKADGSDRQKAGEAYANLLKTKQGQDLLEKAGFVGIHQ